MEWNFEKSVKVAEPEMQKELKNPQRQSLSRGFPKRLKPKKINDSVSKRFSQESTSVKK